MTFGGWHFWGGLMYLLPCAVITFGYVILLYLLSVLVRNGIHQWKFRTAKRRITWPNAMADNPLPPALSYFNRAYYTKAAVLVAVLVVSIYFHTRVRFMGAESRHAGAKEYWTTGQVVFAHRYLLERLLHPDNPIILPYTLLQRAIFASGAQLLPENDGEREVWRNAWFIYPYSRTGVRPYGVGDKKLEPKMVRLLDECWQAMEGMATKEIADPQMKRKALIEFPFLLSYYALYQGHYTGAFLLSGERENTDRHYVARKERMLGWLDDLHQTWVKNQMLAEIWKDYPYVAAAWQLAINQQLHDLTLSLFYFDEFSCEHPLVERMYNQYQDLMSDDPARNSFLNLHRKNARQASLHYQSAVYSPGGSAGNYLLSHICGKKMPEERYLLVKRYGMPNKFYNRRRVEFVFQKELKIENPLKKRSRGGKDG